MPFSKHHNVSVLNLVDRIKNMFEENILTDSESITIHLGELGTVPLPSNTLGDLYHVSFYHKFMFKNSKGTVGGF